MIGVKLPGLSPRFFGCMAVLALASVLAGCGGMNNAEQLTCPSSAVAPDLDAVVIFPPGGNTDAANILAAGKIFSITQICAPEKGGILVSANIVINAVRVAPQVQRAEYVYFVAVVDGARNILNEQRFTLTAQFGNQDFRQYNEQISVHLPLAHVSSGDSYVVLTGFQLTPDQIEFNRAHKQSS